jgi:hypothetical protein
MPEAMISGSVADNDSERNLLGFEKLALSTSGAEAHIHTKAPPQRWKRCATQKPSFPA